MNEPGGNSLKALGSGVGYPLARVFAAARGASQPEFIAGAAMKGLFVAALLLLGCFMLRLVVALHRFALFLGGAMVELSLVLSGFLRFALVFADTAIFALRVWRQ